VPKSTRSSLLESHSELSQSYSDLSENLEKQLDRYFPDLLIDQSAAQNPQPIRVAAPPSRQSLRQENYALRKEIFDLQEKVKNLHERISFSRGSIDNLHISIENDAQEIARLNVAVSEKVSKLDTTDTKLKDMEATALTLALEKAPEYQTAIQEQLQSLNSSSGFYPSNVTGEKRSSGHQTENAGQHTVKKYRR